MLSDLDFLLPDYDNPPSKDGSKLRPQNDSFKMQDKVSRTDSPNEDKVTSNQLYSTNVQTPANKSNLYFASLPSQSSSGYSSLSVVSAESSTSGSQYSCGDFKETRNIRDYFNQSPAERMGNRVPTFPKRPTPRVSAADMYLEDEDDYIDGASLPSTDHYTIRKKQGELYSVHLKRPSEYECNSERSCYQPHVKSDEDIALDICNTFWRPGLTFSQYKHGSSLVAFENLWPTEDSLRTLLQAAYQATSLRRSVLDITKLALRCAPVILIQELLNSRIIALDQVFDNGFTMLHLACVARNAEVVTFLCNAGINLKAQDKYGRTAEQVCFDTKIKRLLPLTMQRTLSQSGSRAPTPSLRKIPSLHDKDNIFQLAQQAKQYDELQIKLQTLDFDVNEETSSNGDCLIHVVVSGGLCQLPHLLSLVRDHGADVDLCNKDGLNALMIAASNGNTVLVDVILCVFGSNPNSPNPFNGYCAIHYAAVNNHVDVANCLVKRGADFNLEEMSGQRADDIARRYQSYECEEFVLTERRRRVAIFTDLVMNGILNAQDLRVTDLYQLTEQGETLIMLAAKYNRTNNLRILIGREGCPIDAQHGSTGKTALTLACVNGHVDSVRILMRHDANASLKDTEGLLPIHHAVINDEIKVAEVLLQYPRALIGLHVAYRNARSQAMRDLLKLAVKRRQSELVSPALFEMSLTGDAQSLYCLLEDGDDVNPISGVGNWPMYLAAEYGHLEVMKLLHHYRADITKKHPSTKNTVLHVACERGHVSIVQFVLKFSSNRPVRDQIDINGVNNDLKTPLHLASEKGSRKSVVLLLDHGASTAVPDQNGELINSPQYLGVQFLIESKREEHVKEIVEALKEKKNIRHLHDVFVTKFDHNLRDPRGDTPLMIACKLGNFLAVKYLIMSAVKSTEECEPRADDSDDDSGVSWAAGGRNAERSRQRTTSQNEPSDDEEGPAWMVASTGHMENRKPRGLRKSSLAHSKFSVLMSEEQYENRIKPKLHSRSTLNLGSDEEICCDIFAQSMGESHVSDINPLDGRAAIHRAIEQGDNVTVVRALIDADRNCVNIQDVQGLSPLHVACRLGRKKVVQIMVSMPFVDLNLRTLDGKLPEEMTSSKRLVHMIKLNRQGDTIKRNSLNMDNSVDASDSASQAGGRRSTVLDLDDLNERFNKLRSKVFRKEST